ncbi:MAG: hypothetical protein FWD03_02740 [Defluviitaleaceae bacterium]|nr:hypothetical protein [Defluviitaleaceae bacterium]
MQPLNRNSAYTYWMAHAHGVSFTSAWKREESVLFSDNERSRRCVSVTWVEV